MFYKKKKKMVLWSNSLESSGLKTNFCSKASEILCTLSSQIRENIMWNVLQMHLTPQPSVIENTLAYQKNYILEYKLRNSVIEYLEPHYFFFPHDIHY